MSNKPTLADIDRAYALFSNHTALEILDTLGRGQALSAEVSTAGQQTINDAIALLCHMGLVTPGTAGPPNQPVRLTPRGQAVVEVLEEISNDPA